MTEQLAEHVAERIFDEIKSLRQELGPKIDRLGTQVTELGTEWALFRPLLMGNGKPALCVRMDRLERVLRWGRWCLSALLAPLAVYACYALFEHWLKLP